MATTPPAAPPPAAAPRPATAGSGDADDDEDPWITRIRRSGCFGEHEALQDCYHDKHDWRQCRDEMARFRECFARHNSHQQAVAPGGRNSSGSSAARQAH